MVRWPVPILAASCAVVLLGAIFVPTYQVSYDDRAYQPTNGFGQSGLRGLGSALPAEQAVHRDDDGRVGSRHAQLGGLHLAGPRGRGTHSRSRASRWCRASPDHWADHSTAPTIPYLFTTQGGGSGQQLPFNQSQNGDTDQQAQIQADTVATLGKTIDLTQKLADDLHTTVLTLENLQAVTDEINDDISNLDDFIRPLKNYFYWEPHCFDIPVCYAFKSLFDGLDGIDALDEQIRNAVTRFPGRRRADAPDGRPVEDPARRDAGAAGRHRQLVRPRAPAVHPDRPDLRRPDQRGQRLRQVPQRLLLLHAAGGVRQRGRQDRYAADDVAGRQGGPLHRHPRGQRHGPRRYRTRRRSSPKR